MRFLKNPSTDPWYNMSFDEYCLEQYLSDDNYFYLWRNRPSVIIGLNQNAYSEVNLGYLEAHGIRLARRVTGGGAVYHDLQNLNYTLIGKEVTPQPVADALALTNKAVVEALDGLPAHKLHCSVLAEEAIKAALKDYYDKHGIAYDHSLFPDCEHCEGCE